MTAATFGTFSGLFALGIILGSVFILAMILIMYYKQITEGYEDQSRFEVMQKVGMTKRGDPAQHQFPDAHGIYSPTGDGGASPCICISVSE